MTHGLKQRANRARTWPEAASRVRRLRQQIESNRIARGTSPPARDTPSHSTEIAQAAGTSASTAFPASAETSPCISAHVTTKATVPLRPNRHRRNRASTSFRTKNARARPSSRTLKAPGAVSPSRNSARVVPTTGAMCTSARTAQNARRNAARSRWAENRTSKAGNELARIAELLIPTFESRSRDH